MIEDKTLCELKEEGFIENDFEQYKKLVRKGKYVCNACGRVAGEKKYLCEPVKL